MRSEDNKIENTIVAKAKALGASLAGIANIDDLKASPSYEVYDKRPFYEEYKGVKWNEAHRSVLVWALVHPESEPVLDWWSMKVPGFTPGNGVMRLQSRKLRIWLGEELGIKALSLPYQIEYGGALIPSSSPSQILSFRDCKRMTPLPGVKPGTFMLHQSSTGSDSG